ncbi:MAG: hypothetical protein QXK06_01585 [Candidatus Diapherotrites archaeon]
MDCLIWVSFMADYVSLGILVFFLNIMPALMPPTWVVLSLAKINDPSFNPFLLAFVGAVCSTCGRAVLTFYSGFFRRFFNKELAKNAAEIKAFFDQREGAIFIGSFLFALSPIPSNLLFVASGLTKIKVRLLLVGFFCGRLLSYFALVVLSHGLFAAVEQSAGPGSTDSLKLFFDVLGIVAAALLIFVDWKQVGKQAKRLAESTFAGQQLENSQSVVKQGRKRGRGKASKTI